MKNKSFIIIVLASSIAFFGLLFSIYTITTKKGMAFYTEGYVSLSDAENSQKVYFDAGTNYKKGYNNEIIFKNTKNVQEEVDKYSFVFFKDKSIGFLADGVLMDVSKMGETFIPYYNIKSNYIVEYKNDKYNLSTTDKDITFENFIGRITNEKYIVAGNNLKLKLASSEELISNYYFELYFSEGDIVKISNDNLNLETISSECYILVNDTIKVNLSDRKIYLNGEEKIDLEEIIIDNNDNIDIDYKVSDSIQDQLGGSGSGGAGGAGEGEGDGNGTGGSGGGAGGAGNENGEGESGEGSGQDGQKPPAFIVEETTEYVTETVVEYKKVPFIELINSSFNAKKITLDFNVVDVNKLIKGDVKVRYLNLQTGEAFETQSYSDYSKTIKFVADNLAPNTSYVVTIFTDYVKNGNTIKNYAMFQRTFTTKDLGIVLEKDYVTDNSIDFNISLADNSFQSGKLNLYDEKNNLIDTFEFDGNSSNISHTFENNIKSNTKYIAKIENISYGNVEYTGGYAALVTVTTLKHNPKDNIIFQSPIAIVNKKDYNFTFELIDIQDPDKSIKKAVYNIYKVSEITEDTENLGKYTYTKELVKTIDKANTASFIVELDEQILAYETYVYDVTLVLNDNEKTVEYTTPDSNLFSLKNKVSPTAVFEYDFETGITSESITGTFVITDPDNTINTKEKVYVSYYSSRGEGAAEYEIKYVDCSTIDSIGEQSKTTKCASLHIEDLESDDEYLISLYAHVDLKLTDEEGNFKEGVHTKISTIKLNTEHADKILVDYKQEELDIEASLKNVFKLCFSFELDEQTPEEIKANLASFEISLYQGKETVATKLLKTIRISNVDVNIITEYFEPENPKCLTANDFGLSLMDLKQLNDFKISESYTIALGNGRTTDNFVRFSEDSYTLYVNSELLEITQDNAIIDVVPILNREAEKKNTSLNDDTIVGIKATPIFTTNPTYVKGIKWRIIDVTEGGTKNYREFEDVVNQEYMENNFVRKFMLDDEFLKRGRIYRVTYQLKLDVNDDEEIDFIYPVSDNNEGFVEPEKDLELPRQKPMMNIFPWESTSSSIVYKFTTKDVDKTLDDNYLVFYGVNSEEYTGLYQESCSKRNDVKITSSYKCVNITNLVQKDPYEIYLKANLIDKKNPEKVVINKYTFEGIYENLNNLHYEIVKNEEGNPKYNNILVLKLNEPYDNLADDQKYGVEQIKKRVAYYTFEISYTEDTNTRKFVIENIHDQAAVNAGSNVITFTENGNLREKYSGGRVDGTQIFNVGYVSTCEDEINTCVYIDYSRLYTSSLFKEFMKFKDKELTIKLTAKYDTGEVGFYVPDTRVPYTFQVIDKEQVSFGTSIINNTYVIVNSQNNYKFQANALAASNRYKRDTAQHFYGFVDDGTEDYPSNDPSRGQLSIINESYANLSTESTYLRPYSATMNYKVTSRGIVVEKANAPVPITAKKLGDTVLTGASGEETFNFSFDSVAPAIRLNDIDNLKTTYNGIKLDMSLSGITEEDIVTEEDATTKEDMKFLYLEALNTEGNVVKTIKINKDELTSINTKIVDNKVTLPKYDDYYLEVTSIELDRHQPFSYDYRTGILDFQTPEDQPYEDNTPIKVNYKVVFTGLNVDTNYSIRAYVKLYNKDKEAVVKYLADADSKIYGNFEYHFKTRAIETDSQVNNVRIDYEALADYQTRYMTLDYLIDDFVGIDKFVYQICNQNNEALCVDSQKTGTYEDFYNHLYETYFYTNSGNYNSKVKFDISDIDILFNDFYFIKIHAVVKGEEGQGTYKLYEGILNLRALREPTIKVDKASRYKNGYYLTFDILFDDPDRVIVKPDENGTDGTYTAHLINNSGNMEGSKYTLNVAEDMKDKQNSLRFDNLEEYSLYRLIINYYTDTRDANRTDEPLLHPITNSIYTLNNHGVSAGYVDYTTQYDPEMSKSILRLGYATNITRDDTVDENGEIIQEAYVAGITYRVTNFSGITTNYEGQMFFIGDNKITYVENTSSNSNLGDHFYRIELPTEFNSGNGTYNMEFKFYIGGKVVTEKGLTTKETCLADEASGNYWDETFVDKDGNNTGACYILDTRTYSASAAYEEGAK